MAARIGMSTGKEWIVEGAVDQVASKIMTAGQFTLLQSEGKRICVFRNHVAYVEEEQETGSVYAERFR